jgi:hypothetical protein
MSDLDDSTDAFLENEKLEQTNDYLRRARPYAGLDAADLEARWVAAFRDFAADIGDDSDIVRMFDLEAEYRLRRIRLPEELVAAEQERLDRDMENWLAEDPESWDQMADQVLDEIATFRVDSALSAKN